MNAPLYTTEILRLAASLPVATRLAGASGRGDKRSPTCGSRIVTEVRTDADGRVVELAQAVQACAFGQASAALVQRFAVGRSVDELRDARAALARWLGGEGGAPVGFEVLEPARTKTGRHGAMLLPFDALIAAMEDGSRHSREGGSPALDGSSRDGGRKMDPRLRGDDGEVGGDEGEMGGDDGEVGGGDDSRAHVS